MIFIYVCTKRKCREYHEEIKTTLGPREFRESTGGFARCKVCGKVLRLRNVEQEETDGRDL